MENEKIFVVVPVYKAEPYLERCIDSILNQTYTNWELVLIDDGSPDNCGAICDRYAAEHQKITVIHQENGGVSAARNAGILYTQKNADENEWVTFIDSDDYVNPDYLHHLYAAAKNMNADISSCRFLTTSAQATELSCTENINYSTISPEEYWQKDRTAAMVICCKLYRVHCFDNILYPIRVIHEDEFVTYKIIFKTSKIALIDAALYHYFFNENSIMHSEWSPKRLAALDAFEEQINYFTENNYFIARKHSIQHLLQHSIKHLMFIKNLSPKYDHLIKEVKVRRNKAFRLYAKEVGLKKAVAYWYEVRIKAPMKRVLGKESVFSFLKRRIKKKLHL